MNDNEDNEDNEDRLERLFHIRDMLEDDQKFLPGIFNILDKAITKEIMK